MSVSRIQLVLSNEIPEPQEQNAPRPMTSSGLPKETPACSLPACVPAKVIA